VDWIKRFILFHGKPHREKMGAEEVRAFLSDLAANQNVATSTQNQTLSALMFLYLEVLKQDLPAAVATALWAVLQYKDIQVTGHRPVATPNCFTTPERKGGCRRVEWATTPKRLDTARRLQTRTVATLVVNPPLRLLFLGRGLVRDI